MLIALISAVLLLTVFIINKPAKLAQPQKEAESVDHIYASWNTMEFDKCVAAWLIVRFIDKNARFVFYPPETEIRQGVLFDVPGADWSRKHRKCTSQCILESIDKPDLAIEKIVSFASKVELNFWQLEYWPEAQECFYSVKEIMDKTPNLGECFEKTALYFDRLYNDFKKEAEPDNNI